MRKKNSELDKPCTMDIKILDAFLKMADFCDAKKINQDKSSYCHPLCEITVHKKACMVKKNTRFATGHCKSLHQI